MVNNTRTTEKIVNIAIRLPEAIFQPALTRLSVYIHWRFRVRGEKSIDPNTKLPSQHYVTCTMFTVSYGFVVLLSYTYTPINLLIRIHLELRVYTNRVSNMLGLRLERHIQIEFGIGMIIE